jgi:hypothetical protein
MVDGTIREVNSPQKLKDKFGSLFMLKVDVKLEENNFSVIEVDNIIQEKIPFLRRMSEAK